MKKLLGILTILVIVALISCGEKKKENVEDEAAALEEEMQRQVEEILGEDIDEIDTEVDSVKVDSMVSQEIPEHGEE